MRVIIGLICLACLTPVWAAPLSGQVNDSSFTEQVDQNSLNGNTNNDYLRSGAKTNYKTPVIVPRLQPLAPTSNPFEQPQVPMAQPNVPYQSMQPTEGGVSVPGEWYIKLVDQRQRGRLPGISPTVEDAWQHQFAKAVLQNLQNEHPENIGDTPALIRVRPDTGQIIVTDGGAYVNSGPAASWA